MDVIPWNACDGIMRICSKMLNRQTIENGKLTKPTKKNHDMWEIITSWNICAKAAQSTRQIRYDNKIKLNFN